MINRFGMENAYYIYISLYRRMDMKKLQGVIYFLLFFLLLFFISGCKTEPEEVVTEVPETKEPEAPEADVETTVETTEEIAEVIGEIATIQDEIEELVVQPARRTVRIQVQSGAFSPNGDNIADQIQFYIFVSHQDQMKSWKVEVFYPELEAKYEFSGKDKIPPIYNWDGKLKDKVMPEGDYQATLTVEYKDGQILSTSTAVFKLDLTAPDVKIALSTELFSPDGDGVNDTVTITLTSEDWNAIIDWELNILDPVGKQFKKWSGVRLPDKGIIWNGLSDFNELVQSAYDYPIILTVMDTLGNTRTINSFVPVDILVMKEGDMYKIVVSSIVFLPGTADFINLSREEVAIKNIKTLKRLAEIFTKYKDYKILLVGHGVHSYFDDPEKIKKEDEEYLIPLTEMRCEAVKKVLVALGVDASRITTKGMGGSEPLVPHSDLENRWINRRVEFFLIK
jgi:flagellar motor protein MotB